MHDTDQRTLVLPFTAGDGELDVEAPPNANVAPPGFYYLFIMVKMTAVHHLTPFALGLFSATMGAGFVTGATVGYARALDPLHYVTAPTAELARLAAEEHVQPTEANPVIVFTLRPGVRFHDGRELTARDVQFTYETIVDPRNLSPRVPDFEPVKRVETPDPRTVRVTYKRLFQPGFESWAMTAFSLARSKGA